MKLLSQLGLQARWQALSERDRKALVVMFVVIVGALFYLSVWQPSQASVVEAKAFYEKERELNEYLNQRLPQTKQHAVFVFEASELYETALKAAQVLGVNPSVLKLNDDNQLEVAISQLSAADLFAWLAELHAQNIVTVKADLNPQGQGLLSGQLVLANGG